MRQLNYCFSKPYYCYFDHDIPDSVRDEGDEKEDGEGQLRVEESRHDVPLQAHFRSFKKPQLIKNTGEESQAKQR